jgi:hypothetical protein
VNNLRRARKIFFKKIKDSRSQKNNISASLTSRTKGIDD